MTCREVRRLLPAHADGALDARAAGELDRHLADCTSCAGAMEELRAILAHAPSTLPPAPPELYWNSVVPRLHERIEKRRPVIRLLHGARNAFSVGVAAAAIGGLTLLLPVSSGFHLPDLVSVVRESRSEEMRQMSDEETVLPGVDNGTMTDEQDLHGTTDLPSIRNILADAQPAFSPNDEVSSSLLESLNDQQLHSLLASVDVPGNVQEVTH